MTAPLPIITGLHHVTAITSDAQRNVEFYCGVLGLRLVKRTVNFDDPRSYHLYYGDELGRPGTALTFFAWPGVPRGRIGPPQVTATAFAAPAAALGRWQERLRGHGVEVQGPTERLGQPVLGFDDPDGMRLELVGVDDPPGRPWRGGPVPAEEALRGFHSVTISEEGYESTAQVLTGLLGFTAEGTGDHTFRHRAVSPDGFAATVDLRCVPDARHGLSGAGIVHHVAFRTPDLEQQRRWRERIVQAGFNVSPVMDRTYFSSIYFREPGGVLFEIATEGPGFTVDEPVEQLGSELRLPPWMEPRRDHIESALPPLSMPRTAL